MKNGLTILKDNMKSAQATIDALANHVVLVGIPSANNNRPADPDDPHGGPPTIGNAELGYIHEFGAPEANIPPRPFLIPGVKKAGPKIQKILAQVAKDAMNKNIGEIEPGLHKAGLVAATTVQGMIQAGLTPALSPNTFRARDAGLTAEALKARKPLIDTGALLKSVTYIVRKKKGKGSSGPDREMDAKANSPAARSGVNAL